MDLLFRPIAARAYVLITPQLVQVIDGQRRGLASTTHVRNWLADRFLDLGRLGIKR